MTMTNEDKIAITLTLGEWNVVVSLLAKQPYELSAALIQQIQVQAANQMNQFASQQAPATISGFNGALEPIGPAVDNRRD